MTDVTGHPPIPGLRSRRRDPAKALSYRLRAGARHAAIRGDRAAAGGGAYRMRNASHTPWSCADRMGRELRCAGRFGMAHDIGYPPPSGGISMDQISGQRMRCVAARRRYSCMGKLSQTENVLARGLERLTFCEDPACCDVVKMTVLGR